jgi:hypothetical protein
MYAGRFYQLVTATVVMVVLLAENGRTVYRSSSLEHGAAT